jgi:tetratricopeptide (TPR) repeat protein
MDAQTLYRQGVRAIRDNKDVATGQRLLISSLRQQPDNDQAWLWLSRTYTEPARKLHCVEQALKINPHNPRAQTLQQKLQDKLTHTNPFTAPPVEEKKAKTPTLAQQKAMMARLKKARQLQERGDDEDAIEQWVQVLEVKPDEPEAIRGAVTTLVQLGYLDDAKTLIWRAINAGTRSVTVYLTALDFALRENNTGDWEMLSERMIRLPDADAKAILTIGNHYADIGNIKKAIQVVAFGLKRYPDDYKLHFRMAQLCDENWQPVEARQSYRQVVALAPRSSEEGQEADHILLSYTPEVTDRQRGSVLLAVREVVAIILFYLVLAWQDAGLDLVQMTFLHWVGLIVALPGAYLVVTATSSPQQIPLAARLGGKPPRHKAARDGNISNPSEIPIIPEQKRYLMGSIGTFLLLVAFVLVFSTSLRLLFDPIPPNDFWW